MNTQEIKNRLATIVQEVASLYKIIEADEPVFPLDAQERLANGICLECKQPFKKSDKPKRGCHVSCHRRIMRAIEKHKYTEDEAIAAGTLAPAKKGGRPPELTELEKEVQSTKQVIKAQEGVKAKRNRTRQERGNGTK